MSMMGGMIQIQCNIAYTVVTVVSPSLNFYSPPACLCPSEDCWLISPEELAFTDVPSMRIWFLWYNASDDQGMKETSRMFPRPVSHNSRKWAIIYLTFSTPLKKSCRHHGFHPASGVGVEREQTSTHVVFLQQLLIWETKNFNRIRRLLFLLTNIRTTGG